MKKIIKFKNNIFQKVKINGYSQLKNIINNIDNIKNMKQDLEKILVNFGNKYESREIWLKHKKKFPPKTSRCTEAVVSFHIENDLTTYFLNNFEDEDKIELITVINFKKQTLSEQIDKLDNLISFLELVNEKSEIKILLSNVNEYPNWLKNSMEKIGYQKTKLLNFLDQILNNYGSLKIPEFDIKLEGELIINFSNFQVTEEFKKNNKLNKSNSHNFESNTIVVNSKYIKDFTNIKSINKNATISFLKDNNYLTKSGFEKELNLDKPDISEFTIGVLDSMIPTHSPYKNYISVTSFISDKSETHHGEGVSSIAMFGDKINNFDDGCGLFNIELFEIFENGVTIETLVNRIRKAISTRHREIKIWNLSINEKYADALESGMHSWFSIELDKIQKEFNVIIVQSAGNTRYGTSDNIKSPADSLNSLVVASVDDFVSNEPSYFSLNGYGNYSTRKPDIAFFGGGLSKQVKVIQEGKVVETQGTSFSAPFVARKLAYLVYHKGYSLLAAKALIIHSSFKNSDGMPGKKLGWGVCPTHIVQILNTNNDEIRFIFEEDIDSTKKHFSDLKIPEGVYQDFSTFFTWVTENNVNGKYGSEYVRTSVSPKLAPLKDGKTYDSRKIQIEQNEKSKNITQYEKDLAKYGGKWKTVACGKDIIKRVRSSFNENYKITTKLDKRMDLINDLQITQRIVMIVTLKHIKNKDLYDQFIQNNLENLIIKKEIVLDGEINLFNKK